MKINLLTAILFILPFLATSQVSLNASMAPALNSMFLYYDAGVPSPPFTFSKTGTNNTWDFSVVTPVPGADDTTFIIAPSSAPSGASFPTATHCTYDDGTNPSYTMLNINASGVTVMGLVADVAGNGNLLPLILLPPLPAMTFPYIYGSNNSGTGNAEFFTTGAAIGQPTVDSIHLKGTIIEERDVIASGNIILPSGTFPAILERSITTSIDSVWAKGLITFFQWVLAPGYPTVTTDSAFYWYTNNSLLPYARASYNNTGLYNVNYYKGPTTVNIAEPAATSAASIYPNPVTNLLDINFPASIQGSYDMTIYNLQGQPLMKCATNLRSINVSFLKPGIYFLHITGGDGLVSVLKFAKK